MPLLLQILEEIQPCFLGHHPSESPSRIGHQQLSSTKFDEQLLDEFEWRVDLDRDGSLCYIRHRALAWAVMLTRSMYREMSYGLCLGSETDSAKLKIERTLFLALEDKSSGMRLRVASSSSDNVSKLCSV